MEPVHCYARAQELVLRQNATWNTAFLLFYFTTKLVMEPVHCYTRAQELVLRQNATWNTAFLLFYFATKLVMEPVHCYTRAQELVLRHVRPTVLLIPVCGLAFCCPLLASMATSSHNATWVTDCGSVLSVDVSGYTYVVLYLVFCDVLPGVIMLKSSVSISVHLLLHLRHLKSSTNGLHGPKLGAEVRVIRMSLSLAFIYLLFLAAELYTHYLILQQHQNVLVITVLLYVVLYLVFCDVLPGVIVTK
ncbi:taste receptor, type 2, member 202 [Alosa pseudoharengus]|uniref:taste receptor, type 2, member 202 n=1 Tax=Alosa pseudoharengus TaxID=34774 RepID=UPI003F896923